MYRFYGPAVGRYISADPIGRGRTLGVYEYAVSSPVKWSDALGLEPSDDNEGGVSGALRGADRAIREFGNAVIEEVFERMKDWVANQNQGTRRLKCELEREACVGNIPSDTCPAAEQQRMADECLHQYEDCAAGRSQSGVLGPTPSDSSRSDVPSAGGDFGRGRGPKIRK